LDPDLFRVSLRAIFAAIVAEIADKFLLLGVDRDHRLPFSQSNANLAIDVGELRIPVGVAVALLGLAVGLQAVTRRIEQFGHQGAAHLVALHLQRLRQPSHALAGPPQRRFRIPACCLFHHRLEYSEQRRVLEALACPPPPAAEPAPTAHPAPIPSDPARSCSAPCRSPSPPRQCHHIPRQTPLPPRRDDGPVHRERAPPSKTALGWARHRSPPQYMV